MRKRYGIFFDLDGTLVQNEHLKALAFSKAIEQLGGKSHPSIYKEVMGMSGLTIRKHFMKKANIQVDLDEYFELFKSIYEELIRTDLVIQPGAIRFLTEIKAKGVKMALVSGAYASSVDYIIDALNLRQYFDHILTGEDFSLATKAFDKTMRKVMPAGKLQQTWAAIIGQVGQYKNQTSTRKEKV